MRELPAGAAAAFLRHDWPGNVRELENAVRRHLILPGHETWPGAPPRRGDAGAAGRGASDRLPPVPAARPPPSLRAVSAQAAEQAEQELVRRTLTETRWNRREAARRLKISYKALLNKLKKWEASAEDAPRHGRTSQGSGLPTEGRRRAHYGPGPRREPCGFVPD